MFFDGKDYLVIIDYHSRWLEIMQLHSMTAQAVIHKFRRTFSTHGIPDVIISDNGPQFQCKEFHDFAQKYGFEHKTSSPVFPQSNGEAESAVKNAKKILRQKCPDVALLNYRTTPHCSTGVSPAQALMGRQLRTKLPILEENLMPAPVDDRAMRAADSKYKDTAKRHYDKRHGVTPFAPLQPGDAVLQKTDAEQSWGRKGTVVAADPANRTYLVNSPAGVQRRNRKHLQQLPSPRRLDQPSSSGEADVNKPGSPAHKSPDSSLQNAEQTTEPPIHTATKTAPY
jgi:transposase InsO family protein